MVFYHVMIKGQFDSTVHDDVHVSEPAAHAHYVYMLTLCEELCVCVCVCIKRWTWTEASEVETLTQNNVTLPRLPAS